MLQIIINTLYLWYSVQRIIFKKRIIFNLLLKIHIVFRILNVKWYLLKDNEGIYKSNELLKLLKIMSNYGNNNDWSFDLHWARGNHCITKRCYVKHIIEVMQAKWSYFDLRMSLAKCIQICSNKAQRYAINWRLRDALRERWISFTNYCA